jgi:chitin synthase
MEQDKKDAEQAKKNAKKSSLLSFLGNGGGSGDSDEGAIEFSLAGLFKIILCQHPANDSERQQLARIAESLDTLGKRLENIERWARVFNSHLRKIEYATCCALASRRLHTFATT